VPYFELFLRRWVATFLLLPTAALSGDWVAFTEMVCLSALSDLIASRYVAMVPVQVFSNDPGSQGGYAPLVPDRATHRIWCWLSVGALLVVWVGCLSTLSSPGKTMTGHIAFWCVYVLVPPVTAYTTRIAARWVSQRRHRDASCSAIVLVRNPQTTFSSARRLRRWLHPVDLHRDYDGQHPLAVFVPDLDCDPPSVFPRQVVSPVLGRSGCLLARDADRVPVTRGDPILRLGCLQPDAGDEGAPRSILQGRLPPSRGTFRLRA
jgi:hypothetical protein